MANIGADSRRNIDDTLRRYATKLLADTVGAYDAPFTGNEYKHHKNVYKR